MKKITVYEKPMIEVFDVEVEKGFAASDLSNAGTSPLPPFMEGDDLSWD